MRTSLRTLSDCHRYSVAACSITRLYAPLLAVAAPLAGHSFGVDLGRFPRSLSVQLRRRYAALPAPSWWRKLWAAGWVLSPTSRAANFGQRSNDKALKFWLSMGRHVAHLRAESQGLRALVLSMPPHQRLDSRSRSVFVSSLFVCTARKGAPKGHCKHQERPCASRLAMLSRRVASMLSAVENGFTPS